jgi:hypothetical protein
MVMWVAALAADLAGPSVKAVVVVAWQCPSRSPSARMRDSELDVNSNLQVWCAEVYLEGVF